jgi:predicted enzyme related to lactoylglutathione lyase
MNNNPIIHFDVSGPNDERLRSFYADVLGWSIDPKGQGYALVTTGNGLRGAIVENEQPSVVLGVGVADLRAAVDHAVALGGTIVMEPTDNGWVTKAQIADPCGNVVTLIQS